MKFYNNRISKLILSAAMVVSAATAISLAINKAAIEANAYYTPSTTYTTGDAATYYSSIDDSSSGDTLLSALRTLNLSKRKSTVGYSSMGTSPTSSAYIYTDYDPNYSKTDSNGQTYGTQILSFYSGTSTTSWNREHVWPNSRGGGSGGSAGSPYPDADIYMPRPTITAENSNRGNSKYVEGLSSSSSGWDPVTAFGESGCYGGTSIRGECARIIFYCMTVNSNLVLDDTATGGTTGVTMGKLSDLLQWSIDNPVNQRELNRNEGGEYLQGNRNAFVDHPEYACKIWGSYNSTTQSICDSASYATLDSITLSTTSSQLAYGATLQLTATGNYSDGTTKDLSSSVTWTSSDSSVATVSDKGLVTSLSSSSSAYANITATYGSKSAVCQIWGAEPEDVELSSIAVGNAEVAVDNTVQLSVTVSPSNTYPVPTYTYSSSNTGVATVTDTGLVTGVSDGSATITVTATQGSVVRTSTCTVTVTTDPLAGTWSLASSISAGDKVIFVYQGTPAVAGALSSTYLSSLTDSITMSSDKSEITAVPSGTKMFTVGGSEGAYTFTDTDGGLLAASAARSVNVSGTGTSTWTVTFSGTTPTITNGTSTYGSLKYNTSYPRFTTYTSGQGAVSIYKKAGTAPVADSVTLDKSSLELAAGDTGTITATTAGSSSNTLTWSTSDSSVATVSNGTVTAVATGTATITATYGTASATCTVNVSAAKTLSSIAVSGTLSKTAFYEGDSFDATGLTITASYSDGSTADVTSSCTYSPTSLTTSTTSVTASYAYSGTTKTATISGFTVSAVELSSIALSGQTTVYLQNATFSFTGKCIATYNNGTSTAVTPTSVSSPDMSTVGTKTVTVTYTEGSITKTATYDITISDATSLTWVASEQSYTSGSAVSSWTSDPITLTFSSGTGSTSPAYYDTGTAVRVYAGGTFTVSGPANVTISSITVTYYSGDNGNTVTTDVGTYSETTDKVGTWTGSASSVEFTVDGSSKSRYVQQITIVYKAEEVEDAVSLDKTSLEVEVGATSTITATATGTVTWSTSAGSIATVSSDGVVTGIAAGTATITATCGTASATCTVTVKESSTPVTSGDITFLTNESDSGTEITSDTYAAQITSGSDNIASASDISKVFPGVSGLKFGASKSTGKITFTMSSAFQAKRVTSITINVAQYGSDTGSMYLYVNGSSTSSLTVTPSSATSGTYTLDSATAITSVAFATSSKRAYLSSISFTFEETSYTSDSFAQDLLDGITCDSTGATSPTYTKTWSELKTLYEGLTTTEQAKVINATYTVAGTGAETVVTATGATTTVLAQAMYRYDYIVAKYGNEAFISGRTSGVSVAPKANAIMNEETALPLIAILSIVSITAIGGCVIIRKGKEN